MQKAELEQASMRQQSFYGDRRWQSPQKLKDLEVCGPRCECRYLEKVLLEGKIEGQLLFFLDLKMEA